MSFLKELNRKNPKLAPIVSTLVCVGVGWERAKSYAEAQQAQTNVPPPLSSANDKNSAPRPKDSAKPQEKIDLPLSKGSEPSRAQTNASSNELPTQRQSDFFQRVPLELRAVQKFELIKTKQDACSLLEGKVVTYYDSASLVVSCVQRPIEDPDLLNDLVYKQRKTVAEIPAHVYRLIPFGEPWAAKKNQELTATQVCRELNGRYVTSTGTDYFFIEGCKKRPFSTYVELQAHNKLNAPVLSVSPEQLDKLDDGKPVLGSYDREVEALYKIVGDSALSPLGSADGRSKPVRSAEELGALPSELGKGKYNKKNACQEFNNKVISYYSQLFFVTNCQRRPIKEIPIFVQQRFFENGSSIVDLTPSQLESIPLGKELSEEEAATIIK